METNAKLGLLSPLETMLRWNRYCDAHQREGDCILLNEDRTYVEAFANDDEAMQEILNSQTPKFRRNEGFLIPMYDGERYKGMKWVSEQDIGMFIDLEVIKG